MPSFVNANQLGRSDAETGVAPEDVEVARETALERRWWSFRRSRSTGGNNSHSRRIEGDNPQECESSDDSSSEFDDGLIFALSPRTCPSSLANSAPRATIPVPKETELRIFVGSWNMAAHDPFARRKRGKYIGDEPAAHKLRGFLPLGYDIYVLGTQEKVTKHLHTAVLARLNQHSGLENDQTKYQRLELSPGRWKRQTVGSDSPTQRVHDLSPCSSPWGVLSSGTDQTAASPQSTSVYSDVEGGESLVNDDKVVGPESSDLEEGSSRARRRKTRGVDEIRGYGDGALLWRKSTSLAIYHTRELHGRLEVVAAGAHKFSATSGSKGGLAITLRVTGDEQTLTFANCHLEANRADLRQRQLDTLTRELPRALGLQSEPAVVGNRLDLSPSLAMCSEHVVWMGDFNYRVRSLAGEDVLRLLTTGRLRELHDNYDSMATDLAIIPGMQSFREPVKWPTFYPTYKKVAHRSRLPLSGSTAAGGSDTHWARHVYNTKYREPFYKGGRVRERVPGWCDRILHCSRAGSPWDDCLRVEQAEYIDNHISSDETRPKAVPVRRDNYRALNDELRDSDHSPVSCTFLWTVQLAPP